MTLDRLINLQQKISETTKLLKLDELKEKMLELQAQMNAPNFWSNQETAQTVSQDYQDIKSEVEKWDELKNKTQDLVDLSSTADGAMFVEIEKQTLELEKQFADFEFYLLLNGPYDQSNAVVAIHAGSGGTEAQDWAEMLLRMILRFADKMKWRARIIDESRGSEAGYKSVMLEIKGRYAF
ncbi:MAG: PCRF domain-containing protein, partial [Candidatus Komeilibacteria bacterium]|nr:PCRF domain-containing protein [Candidatus Komeilibacteria bacterium]